MLRGNKKLAATTCIPVVAANPEPPKSKEPNKTSVAMLADQETPVSSFAKSDIETFRNRMSGRVSLDLYSAKNKNKVI